MKIRRLSLLALFTSFALILGYVESLLPLTVLPGFRIGLPNIVILLVLWRMGARDAAAVSAVRLILSAALFGSLLSLAYATAGAVCSFLVMLGLRRTRLFSIVAISAACGVTHNLAQIAVAMGVFGQAALIGFLPLLLPLGILSGLAVGFVAALLCARLPRLPGESAPAAEKRRTPPA